MGARTPKLDMLMFFRHEGRYMNMKYNARDRHKTAIYTNKLAQIKVCTPKTNLGVQPSEICHMLVNTDIDNWQTAVKYLYHLKSKVETLIFIS